jgi:hypothetical protein
VIEPGWKVEAASGRVVGRVEEVLGETQLDIFDGLVVASGLLGRRRYVPAEVVGEIVPGLVRLTVDEDRLEEVEHQAEPPGGAV